MGAQRSAAVPLPTTERAVRFLKQFFCRLMHSQVAISMFFAASWQ